jgi:hypothetical protein
LRFENLDFQFAGERGERRGYTSKDGKIAKRVKTIAKCMQTEAKLYPNCGETFGKLGAW